VTLNVNHRVFPPDNSELDIEVHKVNAVLTELVHDLTSHLNGKFNGSYYKFVNVFRNTFLNK